MEDKLKKPGAKKKGTVTFVTSKPSEEVVADIRRAWAAMRDRIYGQDAAPGALPLKRDLPPSKYNDPAFWGVKPKD